MWSVFAGGESILELKKNIWQRVTFQTSFGSVRAINVKLWNFRGILTDFFPTNVKIAREFREKCEFVMC